MLTSTASRDLWEQIQELRKNGKRMKERLNPIHVVGVEPSRGGTYRDEYISATPIEIKCAGYFCLGM